MFKSIITAILALFAAFGKSTAGVLETRGAARAARRPRITAAQKAQRRRRSRMAKASRQRSRR